jgi:hypothetical protein
MPGMSWLALLDPTHVIIEKVPPGMSEWLKTLISALVGAVFAILTSFLSDYVKSRKLKKTVVHQVRTELYRNIAAMIACDRILHDPNYKTYPAYANRAINEAIRELRSDRFRYYFESEKATVYELDQSSDLTRIFKQVDLLIAAEDALPDKKQVPPDEKYNLWLTTALMAAKHGWVGIKVEPTYQYDFYRSAIEALNERGLQPRVKNPSF